MRTKVKICGVTRPEDAAQACRLGAWAIGMIFVPDTPRFLTVERARLVAAEIPRGVLKVGVFADAPRSEIRRVDDALELDLLQLHGTETDSVVKTLGVQRCVKTVFLTGPERLAFALSSSAAYLLSDRPRSGGAAPDAALVVRLCAERERVLSAGGLTPETVGDRVRRERPWGVDVSGGVERAPGVKDGQKLESFFDAVARADREE
ncbi:MAG: hypothetical protein AUJ52_07420 [Elusimicrobia bacterium CG1_02_63_36]|nr:MAG: hypothetical protein AUJ52_07420 [Elusimicrobia bacterium CG1_02_63_36]